MCAHHMCFLFILFGDLCVVCAFCCHLNMPMLASDDDDGVVMCESLLFCACALFYPGASERRLIFLFFIYSS
jgi:hypothetical protein